LLEAGARVSITARTPAKLDEARKQLARGEATRADRIHASVADVDDADDAARAVEGAVQQFGASTSW
jgi:NADP-dependent 3-hydroxy acid dehydrogenase YdfG